MPIVYACIAPHGGNLLIEENAPGPVLGCRKAMARMRERLAAARPDAVAILTPHGIAIENTITVGAAAFGYGELGEWGLEAETDLELASAWVSQARERGVSVTPLAMRDPDAPFPLDWGVTIPLVLLTPETLPTVAACPAREVPRDQLVAWGEALAEAAEETGKRVALIVSADQGHGHAADGPYGFTPVSAEYDAAMRAAIETNNLPRLLDWPEDFAEAALADSYWQTLALIGVQKRVTLEAYLRAYEVDHYFGLLCAEFLPDSEFPR